LDDPIAWLSGEWYPLIVPTFNGFGESLFELTGSFERDLVQNVGHFPQREDPEAIAREELTDFLGGAP
jgi:pimeloyl-ACP methyl ester carboxylesterase